MRIARVIRMVAVAAAAATLILASTASAAPVTKWVWSVPSSIDGSTPLTDLACPSASLCLAVDAQAQLLAGTRSRQGSRIWQTTVVHSLLGGLSHIACAGERLCVVVDSVGNVLTSTQPARAQGWRASSLGSVVSDLGNEDAITGISCPTASLCVAVDADRHAIVSTNPGAAAPTWIAYDVQDPTGAPCSGGPYGTCGDGLTAVSCPSARLCLATDQTGHLHRSAAPSRVAPWSITGFGVPTLTTVSCLSTSFCTASGPYTTFTTTHPAASAAWRRQRLSFGAAWLSCPLRDLCLANDTSTPLNHVATSASSAGAWHLIGLDTRGVIAAIACPTPTDCVAVDDQGAVVQGTGYVSLATRAGRGPRVTGPPHIGALLRATPGRWTGSAPVRFSYRWQRCLATCSNIPNATARRRRVQDADSGARLRVIVTATNPAGSVQRISDETRRITSTSTSHRSSR